MSARRLLVGLVALVASAQHVAAPKLTWDQTVAQFYRSVALLKADELAVERAQVAAEQALQAVRDACDGTVEGADRLQVVCSAKGAQ